MSWLRSLSMSGELCAAAVDGRSNSGSNTTPDAEADYVRTEVNLDAIEGQGLTLHLCFRDLLSAAWPHELRLVCVEVQSVRRHQFLQRFNARCYLRRTCHSWHVD